MVDCLLELTDLQIDVMTTCTDWLIEWLMNIIDWLTNLNWVDPVCTFTIIKPTLNLNTAICPGKCKAALSAQA